MTAKFYSSILREIRAESEYFRVGFYGGFPPFLKNKVFIFRGQEYEKLSDFNNRITAQFTNAKVCVQLFWLTHLGIVGGAYVSWGYYLLCMYK